MNSSIQKIFLACVIVGMIVFLGCVQSGNTQTQGGRVVFTITDAAANMGSVSSVEVTIDQISVQSATKGWVTLSTQPRTYDLLELKAENKNEILVDTNVETGTYNQMRLHISRVVVTDSSGTHEAKLPSNDLKIVGSFVVTGNSTSTASFDFIVDESLHVAGNGQYVMAPVIQVETRENATVSVSSNNSVQVSGGNIKTNSKVGTDLKGNVGVGINVPADANIDISILGAVTI